MRIQNNITFLGNPRYTPIPPVEIRELLDKGRSIEDIMKIYQVPRYIVIRSMAIAKAKPMPQSPGANITRTKPVSAMTYREFRLQSDKLLMDILRKHNISLAEAKRFFK